MKYYPAVFSPDADGGFTVTFPDLPGCVTEGDSYEEAVAYATEALAGFMETLTRYGDKIPSPTKLDRVRDATPRKSLLAMIPILPDFARPTTVSVSIDQNVLTIIDEYAAARGVSRSAILAEGALNLIRHSPKRPGKAA